MNLELLEIKKVYAIGIKGSGIVAIAQILSSMGIKVSGSDTKERFFTDSVLKDLGISYFENFSADNVPKDADLVIYSTAYNEKNNPELAEAKRRNLQVMSYPEILSYIFNQKYGIAVAGTHGKTTTTAMLAEALKAAGTDPAAVVGGKVFGWAGNALAGKGEYFVAEADEFQNKLRLYDPKAIVLTSADWDHPDFFENFSAYKKVFEDFVARLPRTGFLAVWGDSADTLGISEYFSGDVLKYGFSEDCDYKIENYELRITDGTYKFQEFEIKQKGESLGRFEIGLVGKHNVLNAAAVVAVCHKLNLNMEKVCQALAEFKGTTRRFECVGEKNGAVIIDDYGHHPEEIKATLAGARQIYPKKTIWAVFHPHTFSRTQALLSEFSQSFSDADKVIVLDIYGSVREKQGGVHSRDLVELINKYQNSKASYIPTISEAVDYLKDAIGGNDVVITIGAGNVWEVGERLKEETG